MAQGLRRRQPPVLRKIVDPRVSIPAPGAHRNLTAVSLFLHKPINYTGPVVPVAELRKVVMTTPASHKPLGQPAVDHIRREVAHILAIYDLLYPTQTLNLFLYESNDPLSGKPSVIEGPVTLQAGHLSPEFLGQMRRPGPQPGAPVVTIMVSIPRPPLPSEWKLTDAPWVPVRGLKALYRLSPMLYEKIRYHAEMARKRRSGRLHSKVSLARSQGSQLFPPPAPPDSTTKPAILIGMHWLEVGGAEALAFDTVQWALEAGLRVFVVTSVPSIQRLRNRLPDHQDVRFIPLARYLPHHLWPRFVERLALAENIRLVHIHHCHLLYESLPQLRTLLPWVKVIDSTHIVEYADGGYPRTSGVWSNYIDTHHVISRQLVRYYRDDFHVVGKVKLGRMLTRPEGEASPPALRLQARQTTLHVTFIGRLYYQKRPVVVVEAIRALSGWADRNQVELRGTLVGEGPFLGAVTRLLQRYGLQDRVAIEPASADVPALLGRSDILLLPSNNEGLALVCYEALAHGCIPISTDVGAQDEIIPPDLLVPVEPTAAVRGIVAAVDRLWRDDAFLSAQKAALQATSRALAGDPTAREVLMSLYRDAAGDSQDQEIRSP